MVQNQAVLEGICARVSVSYVRTQILHKVETETETDAVFLHNHPRSISPILWGTFTLQIIFTFSLLWQPYVLAK